MLPPFIATSLVAVPDQLLEYNRALLEPHMVMAYVSMLAPGSPVSSIFNSSVALLPFGTVIPVAALVTFALAVSVALLLVGSVTFTLSDPLLPPTTPLTW